ncbi:MAG: hypothetical protein ACOCX3_03735 [Chloroflexota bacterium]
MGFRQVGDELEWRERSSMRQYLLGGILIFGGTSCGGVELIPIALLGLFVIFSNSRPKVYIFDRQKKVLRVRSWSLKQGSTVEEYPFRELRTVDVVDTMGEGGYIYRVRIVFKDDRSITSKQFFQNERGAQRIVDQIREFVQADKQKKKVTTAST